MAIFLTTLGLVVALLFLKAWAIAVLWNWYAVSLLEAPVLSYWSALGLALVFSAFVGYRQHRTPEQRSPEEQLKDFGMMVFNYPFLVVIGWIVLKLGA